MDIYSETLLDHYTHPHREGQLAHPTVRTVMHNPLCGDTVRLDITVGQDDTVSDIAFTGTGCVISQAGTSLLCDYSLEKSLDMLLKMTSDTIDMLLGGRVGPGRRTCADLGMAAVRKAIHEFRERNRKTTL